jgi:hypothetical protein
MFQEREHFEICAMKLSALESKFPFRHSKPLKKVKYIPMLVLFFLYRGKKVSQNLAKGSNMLGVSMGCSIVRAVQRCGVGG